MAAKPFESRIQDLVYNVEVGFGLVAIKVFLYVLGVLGVLAIFTVNQFQGFKEAEAMEYAQLGREWARTGTMTTKTVRPATMWYLITHNEKNANPRISNHPDILHAPMYAWFNGLILKAGNKTDGARQLTSGKFPAENLLVGGNAFLVVCTGLFLFLTARRLFDYRVGFVSATTFFLSNMIWERAFTGLPDTLAMFFGMLAMYTAVTAVTNRQEGGSPVSWIIPVILCAIFSLCLFLTRYPGIILVPGLMIYLGNGLRKKGWVMATVYLLIVILGTMPWLVRNKNVSGGLFGMAPLTALYDTSLYPDNRLDRDLAIELAEEQTGDKMSSALRNKFMVSFSPNLEKAFGKLGHGLIPSLFMVTFLYRFVRQPVHSLRWCMALSLLLLVLVSGIYGARSMDLLMLFVPLAIMFAIGFYYLMLERLNLQVQLLNNLITTGVVTLAALPMIFNFMPPKPNSQYPPYNPEFIFHIAPMLNNEELMCTDMPWATAWYGDRKSVLIPESLDQFYEINDTVKILNALYVTSLTRNQRWISDLKTGHDRSWFPIHETRLGDFPLREGFQLGNLNQMFFTDRDRWTK